MPQIQVLFDRYYPYRWLAAQHSSVETLWNKHSFREHFVAVTNPNLPERSRAGTACCSASLDHSSSHGPRIPIRTPALYRGACFVEPPFGRLQGTGPLTLISSLPAGRILIPVRSVLNALEWFAQRAPHQRHFAVTAVLLTHPGWKWFLFGNGGERRHLCNWINRMTSRMGIKCRFDVTLLMRYAKERPIALRRLLIHQCNISRLRLQLLQHSGVVSCKLEYDPRSINITEDEVDILAKLNVRLIRRQKEAGGKCWTRGHEIDSHAY
ncbi:hypothetical protein JOM56_000504 [Amanita muscaria]